ncbi:endonuclease, partial [Arthrobacter sp. AB6]|nr:endonuclease [Arthrobacter sp. AB6]
MESSAAVAQAEEAVDASVAAFMAALGESSSASGRFGEGGPAASGDGDAGVLGDDPLQRVVDAALDVLGGVARSEAKLAAAKALAAAVL